MVNWVWIQFSMIYTPCPGTGIFPHGVWPFSCDYPHLCPCTHARIAKEHDHGPLRAIVAWQVQFRSGREIVVIGYRQCSLRTEKGAWKDPIYHSQKQERREGERPIILRTRRIRADQHTLVHIPRVYISLQCLWICGWKKQRAKKWKRRFRSCRVFQMLQPFFLFTLSCSQIARTSERMAVSCSMAWKAGMQYTLCISVIARANRTRDAYEEDFSLSPTRTHAPLSKSPFPLLSFPTVSMKAQSVFLFLCMCFSFSIPSPPVGLV